MNLFLQRDTILNLQVRIWLFVHDIRVCVNGQHDWQAELLAGQDAILARHCLSLLTSRDFEPYLNNSSQKSNKCNIIK